MINKVQPKIHYLKDYSPPDFIIESVFLHFDLQEEKSHVKTILNIRRNPIAKNQQAPLILNGEELELKAVLLNGQMISKQQYQLDDESLTIREVPEAFILETEVIIHPEKNTCLSGLYKSRNNFCTQCESHGFRRITYYLDRPDVMSRFSTTITADKNRYPILLSNGNLIKTRELDGNRHWVHWEDPSLKSAYLFALVAGDFDLLEDEFITFSGRRVNLRLYLEKGYKDQGAYALQALKRAMRWDEESFGREYDLNMYMIVAVSDFNMGAMENKGLNVFNTKYILAKPDVATDFDYVAIESVIGHEYFHNWSGNRVTCRDWFQITLKEGLTVLREQLFTEDMTSKAVARLETANVVRNRQFLEDAGPLAHPIRPQSYIEINNFYTVTVYRKGAEVIRMIRTLLSPEIFRKGMDLYFLRNDGHAVTTEDFVKAMEDASGKDLTQFRRWYDQAGTPLLDISSQYDAQQKMLTLTVKQLCSPTPGQPHKEPLHIPLAMGLITNKGDEIVLQLTGENASSLKTRVLEIKKLVETFTFLNISEKPIPSLLREFSAPVKLQYPYSLEELAILMQTDTDPFARWNAGQQLVVKIISNLVEDYSQKTDLQLNNLLINAFSKILKNGIEDLNFLSRLLVIPSLGYLLANIPNKDVSNLYFVREFVKHHLSLSLEAEFLSHFQKNQVTTPYHYDSQSMGSRSLKNICLHYLMWTRKNEYPKLAYQQFKNANNMTDVMGALSALNDCDCEERENALQEFYLKWQKEALVINKWLSLQASSSLPNTLDKVRQLIKHPSFNIHNPNNAYALIGVFGENTICFHDKSGDGYRFVADQVLVIDPKNPQVASRAIQPLTQWRIMDQERANLMRQELERIVAHPGLSKDVYEMASKSL